MILEFIINCLQYPALKVQFKAIQCLQNFEKGLMEHRDVNVMEKYLPQIMQEIARIFEYSVMKMNFILMENVLETITNIAEMNSFENYYSVFMPGLKKILNMIGT
jgi:predicted sugar kinase